MTTERPSAERVAEIRRAPDEGIKDMVNDSYPRMIRDLFRELDAVTREREAFERRIDEQNRQIGRLTAQRVVLENEIADANRRDEGEA